MCYRGPHQHSQETDIMSPAGLEPTIPATERQHTHAVDRAATAIGTEPTQLKINSKFLTLKMPSLQETAALIQATTCFSPTARTLTLTH